ncbi:aldotetraouronic acid ABC transporter substrate-binding protein (TC 3.A.1.1.29) [Amphibacillus marinus]|uniref:Aldotetraouronic acid ABC transporter substrate-binding protein (TC 3.A.1.1.29) n=1 Tax=Amphibacillus marinus TaxID=872970 RepID=A0A1H8N8X7_9BACI|nr:extracellular solute-binding protein [Amphibacillus marinus]SEO26017.1 aldotetraouronic acid ABC transporter substrate-binding protein (TC 3.A.1.1.29) [Amphibacillus marinus]
MIKIRKSLQLALLLLFLVILIACSNRETDTVTNESGTESVTYEYFIGGRGKDMNTNETEIGKQFEEETGVNFQVEHIVGDLNERIGVMIAGGIYPDVIVGAGTEDMLVDAGAFIPLNDLLEEYGQNILDMYADYIDRFTYPDGNIYYIPFGATINDYQPPANIEEGAFWIRRSVLEANDYPEIKTLEEYFNLITAYADENPEIDGMTTIPFTGMGYDTSFFRISNAPNHLAGFPNDGGVMVDMNTHEARVYADSEYAKRYLQALNELNEAGYLDQEMFVMNRDDYAAKLSSGRVLGFFDYSWGIRDAMNTLRDTGKPEAEFMAFPIVFDEEMQDQYLDPPAFVQNRGAGITINAANPERIIQYWDYLIQEDNQKLIMWGIEGEHYQVNDEGRYYRTAEQIEQLRSQSFLDDFGMNTFAWNWPRLNGTFADGNAVDPARQQEVARESYTDEDQELLDAYGLETFSDLFSLPEERPWFPAWSASVVPGSDVDMFSTNADEVLKRHYPRIILGDQANFEAAWNEFETEYRALNVDAYEAFFESIIQDRLEGNW